MEKKKVVVQFIEAGQGHIVTAQSIAECLEKKYSDKIEVIRDYAFRDSGDKYLKKYEDFSIADVCRSNKHKFHLWTQMFFMKLLGETSTLKFVYGTVFKRARNNLIKRMQEQNADAYVSTHFMTYHSGIVGKKQNKLSGDIIAYNPDHNTHGWWDRRGDLFITNNASATKEALSKKMPKDKVVTANFMARKSVLETTEPKEFYRQKLGLPQNKFTIILADGGYASANLEKFTDELLNTDLNITLIPVCGKNEKLYKKYVEMAKTAKPNITLAPQPFLGNIAEFYRASDIFITKAGPNAVTDCVFTGTPILINFYSGPVEKATKKIFCDEYKCGVYEPNAKKAIKIIEKMIGDKQFLNELQSNTKVLDRTQNGAEIVADIIANKILN